MKSLRVRPSAVCVLVEKATLPHSSSTTGWWLSDSASSATRATMPNAPLKSSNANSLLRLRVPSRSHSGTSRASSAASSSGSGAVPGGYSRQCSLTSSVIDEP